MRQFALTLNSEVGPLASTNLGAHSRSLELEFLWCFQIPLVLELFLEQTVVVRVTMTTERLKWLSGFRTGGDFSK